jgi:hypothetical protein
VNLQNLTSLQVLLNVVLPLLASVLVYWPIQLVFKKLIFNRRWKSILLFAILYIAAWQAIKHYYPLYIST